MSRRVPPHPPLTAPVATIRHVVSFYETDAMGIVHHANYVRFLEDARVQFLADHDRPYTAYMAEGLHMPVTHVEVSYLRSCRFADAIDISCWVAWARHASVGFAYRLEVAGKLSAYGASHHALIDAEGRPQRLPESLKRKLAAWLGRDAEGSTPSG